MKNKDGSDTVDAALKETDAQIDKDRQRADQEAANARKAAAERDAAKSDAAQANAKAQALAAERDRLLADAAAAKGIDDLLPDLDIDEASVTDIAKNAQGSKQALTDLSKQVAQLKQEAQERQSRDEAAQAESRRDAVVNDLCNEFEEEFGAGLRNEAIRLMTELDESEGEPRNAAKATLRLQRCFKQAAQARKKAEKETTDFTDPMDGAGRPSLTRPKLQPGSLAEVAKQLRSVGAS